MKFKIKKLGKFCGAKASFYSIVGDNMNLFGNFLLENEKTFQAEVLNILGRIKNMADKSGAKETFFKPDESSDFRDEKVVAFYDIPDSNLRLFCIRLSEKLVIIGGGGHKSKSIIKWQQSRKLISEIHKVMAVSELLEKRMSHGNIRISADELFLEGDLELN